MISWKEAVTRLSKAVNLVALSGCDFDKEHYVFAMAETKQQNDQPSWFWVDKKNGDYGSFNPGADIFEFAKAMRQRSLPV